MFINDIPLWYLQSIKGKNVDKTYDFSAQKISRNSPISSCDLEVVDSTNNSASSHNVDNIWKCNELKKILRKKLLFLCKLWTMERASKRLESVDSADEIKVLLLKREPLRSIVSTAVVISFGIFGGHNFGEHWIVCKSEILASNIVLLQDILLWLSCKSQKITMQRSYLMFFITFFKAKYFSELSELFELNISTLTIDEIFLV